MSGAAEGWESGIACLGLALELLGRGADRSHLAHRYGPGIRSGTAGLVRAAGQAGLKAALRPSSWDRLRDTPRPAIAELKDGRFLLLGAAEPGRLVVLDPLCTGGDGRPEATILDRRTFEDAWTGRLILLATRAPAGDAGRFGLGWFLPAILKHRAAIRDVVVASFLLQVFALSTPLAMQVVVDKVLVHQASSTLEVMVLVLLVVAVFEALLGGLRIYVLAHTSNRIDVTLGARLFAHLMSLPLAWFGARQVGSGVARVRELETIRSFLTGGALTVMVDVVFTVCFLAALILYSPLLALVVAATLPIYVLLSLGITPVLQRRLEEKFRRYADNQAFLTEAVSGVETLKAMALEPQLQRRWEEQLAAYVTTAFRATNLSNAAGQVVLLVNRVAAIVLLWVGTHLVMAGALSVGELVAVNLLAANVSGPVLRLAHLWIDFQQVRLSAERLGDILNAPPEPGAGTRPPMPAIRGDLAFRDVSFRYPGSDRLVLRSLSFDVPAGTVLGIVGASGSGKSTVAKALQALYHAAEGGVLVDGVDVRLVEPASLRRQIGVVLQDNVLFTGTVRENIALADPAMSFDRVVRAARLAGAHDFITSELPEGYDTAVGERGASLSGGQRQRIALARALANNPRILILDEATSALDAESERAILDNMRQIAARRTVVIIAHRFSAVRLADRILLLDGGSIREDGTHDELLRLDGRYAALFRQQTGLETLRFTDLSRAPVADVVAAR
ncbi:type I secretion system permease/ATPase [Roseomonas sp. CCTCC AB2023176]|uniref:type I secretion system permease/ATPase n=1 Tax=Roseomonas sp. CCTCC AB2023176 TaxID=3342640 RepID=UPI0035DBF835